VPAPPTVLIAGTNVVLTSVLTPGGGTCPGVIVPYQVTVTLGPLPPGTYVVTWRIIQPQGGSFAQPAPLQLVVGAPLDVPTLRLSSALSTVALVAFIGMLAVAGRKRRDA
jgi:hypothetical protein